MTFGLMYIQLFIHSYILFTISPGLFICKYVYTRNQLSVQGRQAKVWYAEQRHGNDMLQRRVPLPKSG